MIPSDTACHPYLDIEFLVQLSDHETKPDHSILLLIIDGVRQNIKDAFGTNAVIVVLVGSRPSGDGDQFKYSYHAIVTNVVMQNNYDGAMKQLLRIGMEDGNVEAKALSGYYWFD